jgi:hypothetical protein
MAPEQLSEVQRTFRVTDVRGRRVTMLDPYALHLLRRYDIVPAEPLALIIARCCGRRSGGCIRRAGRSMAVRECVQR